MSLYISASGRDVNNASSSSLDTFRLCRRKFRLSRIDGWKQKDRKASTEFGKCVESAIQYYFENGLKAGDGPDEFRKLWAKWIDQTLTYTDQEGSWKDLNTMGVEMLRLFEVSLPTLPIRNPKFQLNYEKKLWPGDPTFGSLGYTAYVDMLSTLEDGARLITDIKTAKSALDITPNMISLDGQLRKYAWVSGIRDVAFLNFVKTRPDDFKKGTRVTLLEDRFEIKAGQSVIVWKSCPPTEEDNRFQLIVGSDLAVQKMDEESDKIKGKGSTEAKEKLFREAVERGEFVVVGREDVTKVKLQFVRGTIPEEDLPEIGDQIGADVLAMHTSSQRDLYPKDGGVRFPNAICGWCEMRGICLKDDKLRDELLVQIKPKKEEEEKDWLSELEGDSE